MPSEIRLFPELPANVDTPLTGRYYIFLNASDSDRMYMKDDSGAVILIGGLGSFADPMTTIGDVIIRNAGNVTTRLGIGAANNVLTVVGGVPIWQAPVAGVPALTSTQIAFGSGANLLTSSANFIRTAAKVTIIPDGSGALGALYIPGGDAANQYIVLHEDVARPNSVFLTFKSSGGNAIAMGALFAAGAPTFYVFTDPAAVVLASINVNTGDFLVTNLAGTGTRMVTASATGVLATDVLPSSGTYTPTRSAEVNMDANVTMTQAQYMRVGNTVTVSGRFTCDPTLTATTTSFEIDLPVASNFGAEEDAAGTAFCGNIVSMGAEIKANVANNTLVITWKSSDITSQTWSYHGTYQII